MEFDDEKPAGSRRPKVLAALLAVLGILWAVSYFQIRDLKNELTYIAEEKIREYAGAEEGKTLEVAVPVITVSKQFILFGKTTGKIAMYMRPAGESGLEEEPEHSQVREHRHIGGISGIEFFLEKEGGEWLDRESGQCSSQQCQLEGKKAFNTGTHVPSREISPSEIEEVK